MSANPVDFLLHAQEEHPDLFLLRRSPANEYVVICDVDLFEDVLTYDASFGNPVTPNMSVNKNIFLIPEG